MTITTTTTTNKFLGCSPKAREDQNIHLQGSPAPPAPSPGHLRRPRRSFRCHIVSCHVHAPWHTVSPSHQDTEPASANKTSLSFRRISPQQALLLYRNFGPHSSGAEKWVLSPPVSLEPHHSSTTRSQRDHNNNKPSDPEKSTATL